MYNICIHITSNHREWLPQHCPSEFPRAALWQAPSEFRLHRCSGPLTVICSQSHLTWTGQTSCIKCGLVGTVRHIVLGTLKAFVCLGPVLPSVPEVSNHLGCREAQPFASIRA